MKSTEERLNANFQIVKVDLLPALGNIGTHKPSLGDSDTGHGITNTETEPSRAV